MKSRVIRAIPLCLFGVHFLFACENAEFKERGTPSSAASVAIPAGVDGQLLGQLKEISTGCTLDLGESKVECSNRAMDALSEQFIQGARSQSKSLDTLAYALAHSDTKLVTVTAELLSMAFHAPLEEKDRKPTSRTTALALVDTLAKLPDQQALDAAIAILYAAAEAGVEKEFYSAVENHPYKRLVSRTYRYLMAAGGMRVWSKVKELVTSERLEVAQAALDAPTLMAVKTSEQRSQICDWYKSLIGDQRPAISMRASGYFIVCGPAHIEQVLAADEARIKDKRVTQLSLTPYHQMCAALVAAAGPTPEQCARVRQLLNTVLDEPRWGEITRRDALTLLTANFVGKDTLLLAKKYASSKELVIATSAKEAVIQISRNLELAKKREADGKAATVN